MKTVKKINKTRQGINLLRKAKKEQRLNNPGNDFIPTKEQYDFCMEHSDLFTAKFQQEAMNLVIFGYSNSEKIPYDDIQVIKDLMKKHL